MIVTVGFGVFFLSGRSIIFLSTHKPVSNFQWLEVQTIMARLFERVAGSSYGVLWPSVLLQFLCSFYCVKIDVFQLNFYLFFLPFCYYLI